MDGKKYNDHDFISFFPPYCFSFKWKGWNGILKIYKHSTQLSFFCHHHFFLTLTHLRWRRKRKIFLYGQQFFFKSIFFLLLMDFFPPFFTFLLLQLLGVGKKASLYFFLLHDHYKTKCHYFFIKDFFLPEKILNKYLLM